MPAWPMMVRSGSRISMKARGCRNARWSSTSRTRIICPICSVWVDARSFRVGQVARGRDLTLSQWGTGSGRSYSHPAERESGDLWNLNCVVDQFGHRWCSKLRHCGCRALTDPESASKGRGRPQQRRYTHEASRRPQGLPRWFDAGGVPSLAALAPPRRINRENLGLSSRHTSPSHTADHARHCTRTSVPEDRSWMPYAHPPNEASFSSSNGASFPSSSEQGIILSCLLARGAGQPPPAGNGG